MNFIDNSVIEVKSGRGGHGLVSFRREKFIPKGGPDGGDGGNGGSVILRATNKINTLLDFYRLKRFKAKNGEDGKTKKCHGASAEDLILKVPVGTIIYELVAKPNKKLSIESLGSIKKNSERKQIIDLVSDGQEIKIARGGNGGFGNVHFKSSINQAPRRANPGQPGEEKFLELELKLLADVGIMGYPSVGKSTLLSVISAAKPKVADYPFTTLIPNLGIVEHFDKRLVFCDIPGLIKGASKGKGLGDQFLRHVERTKILVHLLDATRENLLNDYKAIRQELKNFSHQLIEKPEIIVINKIDAEPNWQKKHQKFLFKYQAIGISAATSEGIQKMLDKIFKQEEA